MNRILRGISGLGSKALWCAGILALSSLGLCAAPINPVPSGPSPAPRRPNIILILADNVGYGDLGCYGHPTTRTPNLDQLAADGIRFTSYYAGSPDDAPSRAALLTGMEPRHSHAGFNEPLASGATTIAALFQSIGYRTGLIGEWNLGDIGPATPAHRGFDEFAGYLGQGHAQDYYTDRLWRQDPRTGFDDQEMIFDNLDGKHGKFIPDLLTTAAMNFANINKPDQFNRQRPFFLCFALPIAHEMSSSAPGADLYPQLSAAARNRAGLITRMDDEIGWLLQKLKDLKIDTNTAVFFTSITGPEDPKKSDGAGAQLHSAGSLRGFQSEVYEGGLRVPMIVRWPARIKPGQVSDLPWAAWDFLPTAAEIALTQPPEKLDGISVLPTLTGRPQGNKHETLYWMSSANGLQQAVRMNEWKAVQPEPNAPWELYNLPADPGEKQNVAEKNPAELKKIEKWLTAPTKPHS